MALYAVVLQNYFLHFASNFWAKKFQASKGVSGMYGWLVGGVGKVAKLVSTVKMALHFG